MLPGVASQHRSAFVCLRCLDCSAQAAAALYHGIVRSKFMGLDGCFHIRRLPLGHGRFSLDGNSSSDPLLEFDF